MAYSDWQSNLSTNGSQPTFICMSTTVDDLSYTPSEEEKYRDAAQIEATGRRSWKTIKGKGEAVWPPNLEAALIEALERYQPDAVGSKSNKAVGRFPMRNRFISDYIYETTGKRRTPKQVGSRLQQLRDTCREERILKLISHSHPHGRDSPSSEGSVGASLSPPPEVRDTPSRPMTLNVDICLQKELWPAEKPCIHFINDNSDVQRVHLSPASSTPQGLYGQSSKASISSFIRLLDASLEFVSPCALILHSTFYVYAGDSKDPIHTEVVPLQCVSSPRSRSGWLYSSDLAPGYWDNIISSQDMSRYTIMQVLKPISTSGSMSANPNNGQRASRSITVIYRLKFPEITQNKESVSSTAHSMAYAIPSLAPSPTSSAATPRQATSDLAYCQWQHELATSSGSGSAVDQPATSRYYVTSNTRGDLSSHALESSHSHAIVDSPSSYISSHSSSSYTPIPVSGSSKYLSLESYGTFSASAYYSPQSSSWQSESVTSQPYHTAQPHWGTNYC